MAILVTGGAGFIGSHTCVELLNAGEDIVVMDNFYNSNSRALDGIRKITGKDFKFYEDDMLDIAASKSTFILAIFKSLSRSGKPGRPAFLRISALRQFLFFPEWAHVNVHRVGSFYAQTALRGGQRKRYACL